MELSKEERTLIRSALLFQANYLEADAKAFATQNPEAADDLRRIAARHASLAERFATEKPE